MKIEYTITEEDLEIFADDDEENDTEIAHLLINGVLFCNSWWWCEDGRKGYTSLHVNCNDTFVPGADAENIKYNEIAELYRMWRKDPNNGVTAWCMKKRKQKPMSRIYKEMVKERIWDLEELLKNET